MEVLNLAKNKSETYPTECSMVFDPNKKEIFISLEGNFDKTWRVSLEDSHTSNVNPYLRKVCWQQILRNGRVMGLIAVMER